MATGYKPSWRSGDYKAICDRCGRTRKGSELKIEWDMYFVCADSCWEPRQPQDFVRVIPGEGLPVNPARPQVPPTFQNLPNDFDIFLNPDDNE